jgi:hypothetical protein
VRDGDPEIIRTITGSIRLSEGLGGALGDVLRRAVGLAGADGDSLRLTDGGSVTIGDGRTGLASRDLKIRGGDVTRT